MHEVFAVVWKISTILHTGTPDYLFLHTQMGNFSDQREKNYLKVFSLFGLIRNWCFVRTDITFRISIHFIDFLL